MRSSLWLVLWVTNVMFHSLMILSNFQSVQFSRSVVSDSL